ncbi:MAG: hypothetical protein NTV79_11155, partial [Candidatus Aureabacteria bacterium]|nr:hypothetical protein [Candidatus Auribacterota bacterium]
RSGTAGEKVAGRRTETNPINTNYKQQLPNTKQIPNYKSQWLANASGGCIMRVVYYRQPGYCVLLFVICL